MEGDDDKPVQIVFSSTSGEKHRAEVPISSLIREVKEALEKSTGIPVAEQRLIYRGHLLKDDRTLESYKFEDGNTIHFVRGKPRSTQSGPSVPQNTAQPPRPMPGQPQHPSGEAPVQTPFGPVDPAMMRAAGDLMMQNPELAQNMMMNNPQIQRVIEQHPEMAPMLTDPQMISQSLEMMRNPEMMREMTRNTDRAMNNLESVPGGMEHLQTIYQDMLNPLMDSMTEAAQEQNNPTQPSTTTPPSSTSSSHSQALPNPWTQSTQGTQGTQGTAPMGANPFAGFGGGGGGGDMFSGMNPEMMGQMLQNPAVQEMMQSMFQNPDLMRGMMQMHPMFQNNPELLDQALNPAVLSQLSNPETLRGIMQMQQSMSQLQQSGFNPSMGMQPPASQGPTPPTGANPSVPPTSTGTNPSVPPTSTGTNPSAPPPSTGAPGMNPFFNMFGQMGGGAATAGGESDDALASRYASQLTSLEEMGFVERGRNLRALRAANGNVSIAIERLLNGDV